MKKVLVVCLVFSLFFMSCATVFKGTNKRVGFTSNPSQADVYINGKYYGKTPVELKLSVKEEYSIEFRKDGYASRVYQISNRVGAGWVVLDVLMGLIPVIVDAVTGAWYHLDQSAVNAVLEKQQSSN
jgi:hypothetical protein